MPKAIFIEPQLIRAKAWLSLSGKAPQIYLVFLSKRKMENRSKRGKKDQWICLNDGEIIFTYAEAEKIGITKKQFLFGRDQLIDKGFIEIAEKGGSMFKEPTKYSFSNQWKKWDTSEFMVKERKKRGIQVGYCRPKKDSITHEKNKG